ncbi:hypothetical protein VZT92_020229 [Zoarces viviparus]|uniref:Uncharacterized protein n=1 Tax=Zoarces viviparus TaxID=48416 RepID=A0AAW1EER4_ZOAVI
MWINVYVKRNHSEPSLSCRNPHHSIFVPAQGLKEEKEGDTEGEKEGDTEGEKEGDIEGDSEEDIEGHGVGDSEEGMGGV